MLVESITLTDVLPAPGGCNLKCRFCAIAQRGETAVSTLCRDDYLWFLKDTAEHLPVKRLSIQGFEPLLPEVWDLTKELFTVADRFDLGTRVVTNGVYLSRYAEELSGLADIVAVSLDSCDTRTHEKLRGVEGCFKETLEGIRCALRHFGTEGVIVNSVLFPGKRHYLHGMPQFLQQLGVREWSIGPYKDMRVVSKIPYPRSLKESMIALSDEAKRFGINVFLADELRRLDIENFYEDISVRSLERGTYVVRLSPDATCSRGLECVGPSSAAPVWDRKEQPHVFLRRILREVGIILP